MPDGALNRFTLLTFSCFLLFSYAPYRRASPFTGSNVAGLPCGACDWTVQLSTQPEGRIFHGFSSLARSNHPTTSTWLGILKEWFRAIELSAFQYRRWRTFLPMKSFHGEREAIAAFPVSGSLALHEGVCFIPVAV